MSQNHIKQNYFILHLYKNNWTGQTNNNNLHILSPQKLWLVKPMGLQQVTMDYPESVQLQESNVSAL